MADFMTLANAAHEASRTIFRLLTEQQVDPADDDFAHLENLGGRHHSDTTDMGASSSAYSTHNDATGYTQSSSSVPDPNRPLLSPTAESALLELSTNFLLYVAMVMITTMVAKIYFPSWLEPREEPTTRLSHAYMNVMEDAYKSDFSDEEDEEDEEGARGYRDDKNGNDENSKEGAGLLGVEGGATRHRSTMSQSQSSSFLFDIDQESQSKQSVYTNLAICAVMLNLTFVSWGLLQVRWC